MKRMVKVSVIIPVYNGSKYLKESIGSVLKQGFKDYEIVLVNDGSTDDSLEILKKYSDTMDKVKLVNGVENKGIGWARNAGVKASSGEFITFLSADDIWKPNFLEEMLPHVKEIGFCDYAVVDADRNIMREFDAIPTIRVVTTFDISDFKNRVLDYAYKHNMFVNYSCIIGKRKYFEGENSFWEGVRYGEDLHHIIRLADLVEFTYVPKRLLGYRWHGKNTTHLNRKTLLENNSKILKQLRKDGINLKKQIVEYPKVLVAAPTSIRHAYNIDKWVEGIRSWDYPKERIEIMVVDNTPFEYDPNEAFYARLKNLGIRVVRFPWNRDYDVTQMLATCREIYRQTAYFEKFDYIFHLDTDTTIEPSGLKKLISRDKDQIGLVVQVYPSTHYQPPCVFKKLGFGKQGLFYYTWQELGKIKANLKKQHKPLIYKVAAAPLGCLLVKRKVFERVPFTSHVSFKMGEDVWYHNNAAEKGFEFWIDFQVKVKHDNTNWNMARAKNAMMQRIWVGFGPENAKNVEVIDHHRKRRTIIPAR